MPASEIVEYCAPTLAGIKTGSLFSIKNNDKRYVVKRLRKLNHLMRQYGLRIIPLKYAKDYTLVETYTVKSGDNPYNIAKRYSWATADEILKWNNISAPSKLQIGQKLKIYKKK